MAKSNVIPRRFNYIAGEMLVDTNLSKAGDIIHIYKNDCGTGYLALNMRTQKYAYIFAAMLRDGDVFKIIEIN